MIHYQGKGGLAGKLAKRQKEGKKLMLTVSGLRSPGRDRDGEPQDPPYKDGELLEVLEVDVDSVTVANAKGKEMVFAHARGAERLEEADETDWPKAVAEVKP